MDEPLGLALGVAFIGLFVHALFYSGFLEDPLTWLVIGIAAAYCVAACEGAGVSQRAAWSLTGVLFVLVAITLPELGSDPWHFRPAERRPTGSARAAGPRGR